LVKKIFVDGFTDGNCTPKKIFPLEIYRRIYSVGDCVKYRWNKSSVTLSVSAWNTDRRYPSVYSSVIVAATVKCRWINFVCKFVGMIDISRSLSNANRYSPSVEPSVIIFKYVFKNLFRIHNIKLYKLMVVKTNYANKIFIKHQKQKN
jgi:hypothetical protein